MNIKKASAANGGKNQILERGKGNLAIFIASLQDNIYLTAAAGNGKLAFPNDKRLADSLCNAPHCENSGLFYFMPFPCRNRHEYKLAQRPVTVRPGGLLSTGERCAFLFLNPKRQEVSNV